MMLKSRPPYATLAASGQIGLPLKRYLFLVCMTGISIFDWCGKCFQHLFPPPEFPADPEKTRLAILVNDVIGALVIMICLTIGGLILFGGPLDAGNITLSVSLSLLLMLGQRLLHLGWVEQIALAVPVLLATLALTLAYRLGAVQLAHFSLLLLAQITAVLMLGAGAGLLIVSLAACGLGWIGLGPYEQELALRLGAQPRNQVIVLLAVTFLTFALALLIRSKLLQAMRSAQAQQVELVEERAASRRALQQAQRDLEQELRQRSEQLQQSAQRQAQKQKMAALGHLLAGVAHELNTPIGNARVTASTLREEVERFAVQMEQGPLSRKHLQQLLSTCIRASELIERSCARSDLLITQLKQINVNQFEDSRRQIALRPFLEQTMHKLLAYTPQMAVTLELQIAPGLQLETNGEALQQILAELFANTLAHGFAGRSGGKISLVCEGMESDADGNTSLQLIFADDGHGIKADIAAHVFNPFFSTRLGQGNSGLGLYVAHNLMLSLGGRISVVNHSAPGARFCLQLPCNSIGREGI